jgi:putative transposase
MNALPLQFLILTVAGWVNRSQQDVIDYLREENRALREQRGDNRLRFTESQRRRLAVGARKLRRRSLAGLDLIVSPRSSGGSLPRRERLGGLLRYDHRMAA